MSMKLKAFGKLLKFEIFGRKKVLFLCIFVGVAILAVLCALSFFTAYVKKGEPKFVYHPDYTDFCVEINRKNIVGEDGKTYRLTMQDFYYTEKSREIMKKEGVSK